MGSLARREEMRSALDRFFDRLWDDFMAPFAGGSWPSLDVVEEGDRYRVEVELPGVEPKDLQVTCEEGRLVIRGEKRQEARRREEGVQHLERRYGSFSRVVALPESVDASRAEATFRHGVLTITLPKREGAKTHRIQIRSD